MLTDAEVSLEVPETVGMLVPAAAAVKVPAAAETSVYTSLLVLIAALS